MSCMMIRLRSNGPDPNMQADDVLDCMSDDRILWKAAEPICDPQKYLKNSAGNNRPSDLPDLFLSKTRQCKFTRISRTDIVRENLWIGGQETLGASPNANGEYIHVPEFIARRKKNPSHLIFGSAGSEYWYGGGSRYDKAAEIWTDIEARTSDTRANHSVWPFSSKEKQILLCLRMAPLNTDQANARLVSETGVDGDGLEVAYRWRKTKYDWRSLPGIRSTDVLDSTKTIDILDRDVSPVLFQTKTLMTRAEKNAVLSRINRRQL